MVLTHGRTYFEVPGCQRTHPSQELIAANTELLLRRGDYITPRTYITRIYQLRGGIMRGFNIYSCFPCNTINRESLKTPGPPQIGSCGGNTIGVLDFSPTFIIKPYYQKRWD